MKINIEAVAETALQRDSYDPQYKHHRTVLNVLRRARSGHRSNRFSGRETALRAARQKNRRAGATSGGERLQCRRWGQAGGGCGLQRLPARSEIGRAVV